MEKVSARAENPSPVSKGLITWIISARAKIINFGCLLQPSPCKLFAFDVWSLRYQLIFPAGLLITIKRVIYSLGTRKFCNLISP